MTNPRVSEALKLHKKGHGAVTISGELDVPRSTIENWLRTNLHTVCTHCGTKLRRPSVEECCGLCSEREIDLESGMMV